LADSRLTSEPGPGRVPPFLTSTSARVLSDTTKSPPVWAPRTPRWTLECFQACALVPVEGGVYQLNRVVDDEFRSSVVRGRGVMQLPSKTLRASYSLEEGKAVEISAGLYDPGPRNIPLQTIQSIVKVPNRVPALYSDNFDQVQTQLGVTADYIYETVEELVYNHPDFGLLNNISPRMQFRVNGPPTPDVLDDLLALAWRRPDMFVMHPEALAAFRKRANAQQLTLEEVELFGNSFTAWRGLPIIATNKLHLVADAGASEATKQGRRVPGETTTSVLLMRLGTAKQGVVCLCDKGTQGTARLAYISVEYMGLGEDALHGYLLTTYLAMAVLSPGAIAHAEVTV